VAALNAVVLPIPETWRQVDPPRSKYRLGELELDVSTIQGMPEDPNEWMRIEVARRGGPESEPTRVTTVTGWPMVIVETTIGSTGLFLAMFQFLEYAAVATLTGPSAAFAAHLDEVKLVLMQVKVQWGSPPVTLSALLAGFSPPEHS
jgi:hypothetical protein